ncbi:ATP-binding cassette domain-containing protein, partial [Klebsiella pneumoniae]|uniref:ATP-binding cassette domain-containing protein n=1 Tax=Klebsiella pneumoniae TaxID=573 RepID=UPI001F06C323
ALPDDFQAQGELWLDERRCDGLPVEARGLGILFQDALLFDAFSVGQNLMLALPAHIVGRARRNAVEQALDTAGLANHYASDPATLSGGERARVSLLR